jgi:micrococcal nuclease
MAAEIVGTVVNIHDGDTLNVLVDKRPMRIRLAEIDAPESWQDLVKVSTDSLEGPCAGQEAAESLWARRGACHVPPD